jgi:ATP synthase protein I
VGGIAALRVLPRARPARASALHPPATVEGPRAMTSDRDAQRPRHGRAPSGDAARRGAWTGLDQSSVMGVELVAATLTWAGIGWLADRWLGTAPWFLAIGALVGNAAGLYLVWLRSGRMEAREAQASASARRRGAADVPRPGGTPA